MNHPERATSRPAFAVPGTAEFSCAAIVAEEALYTKRKEFVDRCKRMLADSALGKIQATATAGDNVLFQTPYKLERGKQAITKRTGSVGQPLLDLPNQLRRMSESDTGYGTNAKCKSRGCKLPSNLGFQLAKVNHSKCRAWRHCSDPAFAGHL